MIILTAVHQRPEIFSIFLKNIPEKYPLVVTGDLTDACYSVWEKWTEIRPVGSSVYLEVPNIPLGAKWNAGLSFIKNLEFDFVFITGSDDVFSQSFYDYYETKKHFHFIGCLDFYFYDYGRKSLKYCPGFQKDRIGETHGAGRMIHRNLLEKVDFKLWQDGINKALDASMTAKFEGVEYTSHTFRMRDIAVYGVDIKTEINIHSIHEYNGVYVSAEERQEILSNFNW